MTFPLKWYNFRGKVISVLKAMPHSKLQEFVNVDFATEMALVGVAPREEGETIVAVGHFALEMATNAAEVASVVRDDWQGQGIGTHLFRQLLEIARSRGIVQFTGEVMADNAPMLHLFHK